MCSPFPRASSLGRLVLWFPPYVMAPSWTVKFRDRGPGRSLFLSSAQVGVIHRTGQGLSLSFNRWYLDDGACQDTLRLLPGRWLSFKRWVHLWGCLSMFLNVGCLDTVTCPPSLLRWKCPEYLTSRSLVHQLVIPFFVPNSYHKSLLMQWNSYPNWQK